jgi:hypothetical protein
MIAALDPFKLPELVSVRASVIDVETSKRFPDPANLESITRGHVFDAIDVSGTSGVFQDIEVRAQSSNAGLPRDTRVRVEGLDALGNVIAYGERVGVDLNGGDQTVEIQFRRALAYVIHEPTCQGGCPSGQTCVLFGGASGAAGCQPSSTGCTSCGSAESCILTPNAQSACEPTYSKSSGGELFVYALDINSRTLISPTDGRIRIPGTAPRAYGITAVGGEGVAVTVQDGMSWFVDFLSADDHQWSTIPVPGPVDLALIGDNHNGVAAGPGGSYSISLDEKTATLWSKMLSGHVFSGALGADRRKALLAMRGLNGGLLFDLSRPGDAAAVSVAGALTSPVGIAITGELQSAIASQCGQDGRADSVNVFTGLETMGGSAMNVFSTTVAGCAWSAGTQRLFAIEGDGEHISDSVGDVNFTTYERIQQIAAGPEAQRLLVISAGTSSLTAGITAIDPAPRTDPMNTDFPAAEWSILQYPIDPITHERYQPSRIAILNGR